VELPSPARVADSELTMLAAAAGATGGVAAGPAVTRRPVSQCRRLGHPGQAPSPGKERRG